MRGNDQEGKEELENYNLRVSHQYQEETLDKNGTETLDHITGGGYLNIEGLNIVIETLESA